MNEQEIVHYLRLFGEELALEVNQPVRLLLVGGAYMITQIGNRSTTLDIDVVNPIDPYSYEHLVFRNVANFVAGIMHLDLAWLSDNIGEFISETQNIPFRHLWLKHGMLEVYVPEMQYIFVLKMIANREKDEPDLLALMQRLRIKNRKQAEKVLKKYGEKGLLEDYAAEIEAALRHFFG